MSHLSTIHRISCSQKRSIFSGSHQRFYKSLDGGIQKHPFRSCSRKFHQSSKAPTFKTSAFTPTSSWSRAQRKSSIRPLQAGFSLTSLITGLVLLSVSVYTWSIIFEHEDSANDKTEQELLEVMAIEQPGRPGTLTPDEEAKLRQLWILHARLTGFIADTEVKPSTPVEDPATKTESSTPQKSSRFGLFRHKGDAKASPATSGSDAPTGIAAELVAAGGGAANDKHGQLQAFKDAMAGTTPQELRDAFWAMVKHDHPDALLLRFLRARKWDVHAAEVMAISALHWRITDKVDSELIFKGEGGYLDDGEKATGKEQQLGKDFVGQFRLGKSFVKGNDKEGRPLCYIRVRKHRAGDFTEESLEKYTVYTIETARMMLQPPVDTATLVFDMTDFGLANMDYPPVKFMIKCFEANYPESLGAILIHKAPWIFQGIWRVVRGWLDPVVASKVHFTNSGTDLEQFIEPSGIIKELGGVNDYDYSYEEPVAGENEKMKDEDGKKRLLEERKVLAEKYEAIIKEWASADKDVDGKWAELKKRRNEVAEELKNNYWKLDPYIRARSLYDRNGEIKTQNPDSVS